MPISYGGNNITFPDASIQNTASKTGFVNRIINGEMDIDQRNNGAAVTITSTVSNTYTLDRWAGFGLQASKFSIQQSTVAPAGFVNSLLVTSLTAYAVLAGDIFGVSQAIEGLNVSDLAWGTANAQPITISFWVRSSLTGTFSGNLLNSAGNRSYVFSYTISVANTYEYKTITIPGDTTGTWLTTNGIGIRLGFNLGSGTTFSTTAGSWAAGSFTAATGSVSVVGTSGATLYITGVQLEKGSTATPFEFRNYGQELALCQRYYENDFPAGVAPVNGANTTSFSSNARQLAPVVLWSGAAVQGAMVLFKVPKRAQPTIVTYGNSLGYFGYLLAGSSPTTQNTYTFSLSISPDTPSTTGFSLANNIIQGLLWGVAGNYAASAEL